MPEELKIIGEVPDDPRVKAAIERAQSGGEELAAEILSQPALVGFERYGIKLRKNSLNNGMLISSLMPLGPFDTQDQALLMVWALAAPLNGIYGAKYRALKLHRDGKQEEATGAIMAACHQWFDESNIPKETTQEILNEAGETFALAAQLMPKGGEEPAQAGSDVVIKKNGGLGSSSAST